MKTLHELRAEQAKLQREAIAVSGKAQAGDKTAAIRRSELVTSIEYLGVQIAEAEAAEQREHGVKRIEQAKAAAAASADLTAQVSGILEQRGELAKEAQAMATDLGAKLHKLMQLHRGAGDLVRRNMPVIESVSLDTDEIAVVRSVLSAMLHVAQVDHEDAVRSLESLNFGLIRATEDVSDTVEHQNQFLLSIRERFDRRWADYAADLESQQEAA
ncbi:hypothetical protein [Ralstonia pseudosolanacearum]|uniref:hypothetical protein n=1 Tax=Ralstonia pseudosolanacearum TaxID=1310165 RepID=UPI001FF9D458|nr:hypothetical protein [Ralstonia pseudosolanacearum]